MMTELNLFKEFAICSIDELRGKKSVVESKVESNRLLVFFG